MNEKEFSSGVGTQFSFDPPGNYSLEHLDFTATFILLSCAFIISLVLGAKK